MNGWCQIRELNTCRSVRVGRRCWCACGLHSLRRCVSIDGARHRSRYRCRLLRGSFGLIFQKAGVIVKFQRESVFGVWQKLVIEIEVVEIKIPLVFGCWDGL